MFKISSNYIEWFVRSHTPSFRAPAGYSHTARLAAAMDTRIMVSIPNQMSARHILCIKTPRLVKANRSRL